jgi:hypothetical protein
MKFALEIVRKISGSHRRSGHRARMFIDFGFKEAYSLDGRVRSQLHGQPDKSLRTQ